MKQRKAALGLSLLPGRRRRRCCTSGIPCREQDLVWSSRAAGSSWLSINRRLKSIVSFCLHWGSCPGVRMPLRHAATLAEGTHSFGQSLRVVPSPETRPAESPASAREIYRNQTCRTQASPLQMFPQRLAQKPSSWTRDRNLSSFRLECGKVETLP